MKTLTCSLRRLGAALAAAVLAVCLSLPAMASAPLVRDDYGLFDGDTLSVNVGSVDHPMLDAHYIEWIFVQTEHGGMRKALNQGDAPHAEFCLKNDKAVAVYAYCNLHGLWMTEV
mgnify:CR=1 FL=1